MLMESGRMGELYSIALCDDEESELDRIEDFLSRYQDKNML